MVQQLRQLLGLPNWRSDKLDEGSLEQAIEQLEADFVCVGLYEHFIDEMEPATALNPWNAYGEPDSWVKTVAMLERMIDDAG